MPCCYRNVDILLEYTQYCVLRRQSAGISIRRASYNSLLFKHRACCYRAVDSVQLQNVKAERGYVLLPPPVALQNIYGKIFSRLGIGICTLFYGLRYRRAYYADKDVRQNFLRRTICPTSSCLCLLYFAYIRLPLSPLPAQTNLSTALFLLSSGCSSGRLSANFSANLFITILLIIK